MKAAAIDLGTNAFRCLIRNIDSNYDTDIKIRYFIGLGKFLDQNNKLNLPAKYYSALDNIFNVISQNCVKKIHIVGTSVFRDSLNKNEILLDFKKRYHEYVYKMNRENINVNPPYTLDTYKRYIQEYSYDFSQSYWFISEKFLREIKKSLSDFDIKVILLYREPVQRLYSFCNLVCKDWSLNFSPIELYHKFLDSDDCSSLYPHLYHKYVKVFDNIICLKTETFFDNKDEQERLLEFLDLPSVDLQSMNLNESNVCSELSDDDICIGKQKLKPSYDFYSLI